LQVLVGAEHLRARVEGEPHDARDADGCVREGEVCERELGDGAVAALEELSLAGETLVDEVLRICEGRDDEPWVNLKFVLKSWVWVGAVENSVLHEGVAARGEI
jgi:hypothetical protein